MADVVNRDTLEALLARTISRDLRGELSTLMGLLGDPPSVYNIPSSFWENGGSKLRASIEPILQDIYLQQASTQLTQTSIGVDWGLINESAIEWSSQYTFELVRGITDTSRRLLRNSIDAYFRNPTTLGDLQNRLLSAFGARRAEMIAVTEVTRAAAEGEQKVVDQIIADNPGMESIDIWFTNRDDLTCPICAPRHKQPRGSNWTENPPAHPRCRCWLGHDFRMKGTEQVAEQTTQINVPKFENIDDAQKWAKDNGVGFVDYYGMTIEQANATNRAILEMKKQGVTLPNSIRTGLEDRSLLYADSANAMAEYRYYDKLTDSYKPSRRIWINTKNINYMSEDDLYHVILHENAHINHTDMWIDKFGFDEKTFTKMNNHLYSKLNLPVGKTYQNIMDDVTSQSILNNAEFVAEVKSGLWEGKIFPKYIVDMLDNAIGLDL